uniref:Brix domain-containing protein n=1 Tax=Heterosigma akashiwo TaxID=2829 RepID=A0A6V1TY31_HETAK|mmetsp:Transcript_13486/g.23940  ORF Transcript_13486/g.23940 Transcript_13486/m.23940 type:complete len:439 (+) Transcript_13486:30-1346(+)
MPKKGGKRRKRRTHASAAPKGAQIEGEEKVPRSFVFKNKKVSQYVQQLIADLRQVMAPYTALKLKERKKNSVKDYLSVAGTFGVTHFLVLSQTEAAVNLKVARTPQGPTLSFKVEQYTLCKSIVATQKKPYGPALVYQCPPLVVLNNFADATEAHVKLMRVTFQNMFPPINVQTIKLADCRRVVLFHYLKEDQTVEVRHYSIRAVPTGISRSVKRVVQARLPNLSRLRDVSEFLTSAAAAGAASDSEGEDEESKVELAQRYAGRGNVQSQQSSVRLTELGPRLRLRLQKVEKGLAEGDVMYHAHVTKTPQEAADLRRRQEEKAAAKKRRREEQEGNVARKRAAREEKLAERAGRRRAAGAAEGKDGGEAAEGEGKGDNSDDTEEEEEGQQSNNGGSDDDVIKDDNGGSSSTGDTPKKEQAEEGREEEEVDSEEEEFFN